MNVAEALESAANIIDERGWWQSGGVCEVTGAGMPSCASIAITETVGTTGGWAAHDAFIGFVGGKMGDLRAIYDWNDAPGRTQEEVTSTMRACAALWRARNMPVPEVVSTNSPENVAEYNVILDLQAK